MPLETASYISDLQPSYPVSSDLVGQADDHIRLLKAVLKATFPNINGPVTATDESLNTSAPVGLIALWYGSSGSIPSGWALCNGASVARSNGSGNITTPNLVDRFVVGAGTIAAQGATAGAATVTPTTAAGGAHTHAVTGGSHTHTGTVDGTALTTAQLPAHSHTLNSTTATVDGSGGFTFSTISAAGSASSSFVGNTGTGATHTHGLTISSSGGHTHTVADADTHTHTVTVATVPPAVGLHYIMRV
jgi:hypothetical protein